jgi:hypothetical protein
MTAEFVNNPAEAAVLAGFTVQAPAYLPAGYAENGPWSVDRQDSGIYVVSTYGSGEGNHFLLLNQTQFADEAAFNQSIGQNESMTDVMVGQNAAVYITGRLMAHPDLGVRVRNEAPELLPTNWLIWEADGTTYSLFGDDLDQAELVRIAESLSGS